MNYRPEAIDFYCAEHNSFFLLFSTSPRKNPWCFFFASFLLKPYLVKQSLKRSLTIIILPSSRLKITVEDIK